MEKGREEGGNSVGGIGGNPRIDISLERSKIITHLHSNALILPVTIENDFAPSASANFTCHNRK
jgi:hypothetical protein